MEGQPQGNFLYDAVLPKAELIFWLVLGLGLLLRGIFLVQGGDTLLLTGLEGLAIVYFLKAFEPSYTDIADESIFNTLSASPPSESFISQLIRYILAFGNGLTFSGIAFKLLFWKGAAFMLPAGTGMLLLTIAWQSSVGSLTRQTVLTASLGLIAWAIPTETLVRQFYRNDSILVEKMIYQHQHPNDKAATAEVLRRLHARHKH